MAQAALYEESATTTRERSERRSYMVFHIASIVVLLIAVFLIFMSLTTVPAIVMASESGTQTAIEIVVWVLPIALLVGAFFLFFTIKRRFNVSYDYTFVEDELRITKVFNGKSRKFQKTIKCDQILKIGYWDSDSFERTLAGMRGKKTIYYTPNREPAEGKEFIYILYSTSIEKTLIVIECRQTMLEFLVRGAGRNKFERK